MSLVPYLPASSRRLVIARIGWVMLVVVVLGVIIGGISPYFQQLVQTYNPVFADLGLSPSRYAGYVIGLDLLALLVHLLLAAVLYYRRPRDTMALLVAFTLITNGAVIPFSLLVRSTTLPPIGTWLVDLIIYFGLISSVTVLYLFPDGRFTPPWTRYLTIGWSLLLLPTVLLADSRWDFGNWPFLLQWLLLLGWSGTGAWAQLIRYQHMADAGQKQQAKWAAFGLLAAVAAPFIYYLLFVVLPVLEETAVPNLLRQRLGLSFFSAPIYLHFIGITLLRLLTLLFPISFTIAILRHRLWEVDVWINRAVVYGGLTLLVTALYALTVGGMSVVFRSQAGIARTIIAFIIIGLILPPVYRRWQKIISHLVPLPARPPRLVAKQESVVEASATVLNGRFLLLARLAWGIVTLLSLAIFFASLQMALATDLFTQMPRLAAEIEVALFSVFANNYLLSNSVLLFIAYAQFLTFMGVGLFLFWRKSNDWLAILAAVMLISTGVGFSPAVFFLPILRPIWHFPVSLLQAILFTTLLWFLYLFPNGRFTPNWTRPAAILWGLYAIGWLIWPQLNPHRGGGFIALLIFIGWAWTGVVAQIYRYRQTHGMERQQQKWVMIGFFLTHLCFGLLVVSSATGLNQQLVAVAPAPFMLLNSLFGLSAFLIPITIALAILRYRLWEVDVWINRTLVFGGLTLLVTAIYIFTVGLMSNLFQSGNSLALSVLATGLIAILFNPVRQRLQTAVNRLMYGERDDPITVLTALGRRLEETTVPAETLPALVETIAQTLKLPYVAVVGSGGAEEEGSKGVEERGGGGAEEILAAYPSPLASHPSPFTFPLVYQSETIGQLLVAPRAPGELFNPAERRLLENVARQAGTAVYAAQLTHDLQRSRERLVTTREEERRRIHRDLHDGLGPQLATLSLKVDAARNYLTHDPETADHLLSELKGEIQSAINDIRRLVHELRPPTLDQLGLVSALREYIMRHNGNGRLQISLIAPDTLPLLPAAVEVAAYRIALEAITNSVRHAQAHTCQLCLNINDGLQLEIRDDGLGLPIGYQAGVGLSSMRERTAELGGTFHIESTSGGGIVISVQLPFASSQ